MLKSLSSSFGSCDVTCILDESHERNCRDILPTGEYQHPNLNLTECLCCPSDRNFSEFKQRHSQCVICRIHNKLVNMTSLRWTNRQYMFVKIQELDCGDAIVLDQIGKGFARCTPSYVEKWKVVRQEPFSDVTTDSETLVNADKVRCSEARFLRSQFINCKYMVQELHRNLVTQIVIIYCRHGFIMPKGYLVLTHSKYEAERA